ncbi:MAG TPA: pyridoxamine 5'-phosphate oxidase family protein [Gammaproteobacteria bacterium]
MRAVDPFPEFAADRARAQAAGDPTADLGYLATADADGQPAVRTLVLRTIGAREIDLYIARSGAKWLELQANPRFELLVYWSSCRRQYRLRGSWAELPAAEFAPSWHAQPEPSRLLDWYYDHGRPQGAPVPSREALLDEVAALAERAEITAAEEPAPAAAGLRLTATRLERLELCGPGRLHDRRRFSWSGSGWSEQLLVP